MNSQAMSLSESPLYSYNLSPFSNQSSKRSNLEPYTFISFNTHLKNPNLSMKKSQKSRTVAAINNASAQGTQSFYELLGIPESGTLSEIKKAYKQLARKYHPDVSPADRTEENTQMFIRVQEAYKTLSDPQTRASYDRDLFNPHFNYSPPTRASYVRGFYHQWPADKRDWKKIWQAQLAELRRRSMENEKKERMRSQES